MNEQFNNPQMELDNEQAINAIYDLERKVFGDKVQREPLAIKEIANESGVLGIVNPGAKNIFNMLQKLDRKIRTTDDAENNVEMGDIIDRNYNGHDAELFDKLSDWSRFAIIIENHKALPNILDCFLQKFGGDVVIHERADYNAVHLHTNYKDVNVEFQFHTKENAELKKATDVDYHAYNNIVVPKNSQIEDERKSMEDEIKKYCQIVYSHSDFAENISAVKAVKDKYAQQEYKPQTPKLSHFCEYAKKAEIVQNELDTVLTMFIANNLQINAPEKTKGEEQI